ncbi:MAG: hypothetical protein R3E50_07975 [Halioglobus sp.]
MLNEHSYLTAVYIYVGAASVLLAYIGWWLSRHWRPAWIALAVLLLAALLLTPAYPKAGVTTMAPALIVAVFQVATAGPEAASHALRPLIFMCGVAVVAALMLKVIFFRQHSHPPHRRRRSNSRVKAGARAKT